MNRFRDRLNNRRYEMRRENALRMARMRYRLDNMAAGGFLKIGLLVLLGATPFVLYLVFQPDTPTVAEDPVSTITRNVPPPAPLAFPVTSPTPSPIPVESPTPSPSPTPSESPSPNPAQCGNGKDDDRDGRTDFPTDRGCSSRTDRSESPDPSPTPPAPPPPPAPAPAPAPQPAPAPPPVSPSPPTSIILPQCRDGLDNDEDGRIDWQDLGCASNDDNDESGPSTPPPPSPPAPAPAPPASAPRLTDPLDDLLPGATDLLDAAPLG